MAQRQCSVKDVENNVAEAERENRLYGDVEVLVNSVSGTKITFVISGDKSGKSYTADFADRTQVWPLCPSTIAADETGAPSVGDQGILYLSEAFLTQHGIATTSAMGPKWPPRMDAPPPPTARLEVFPLKLELTGVELRSGEYQSVTIDLLDPAYAGRTQSLVLDRGSPLTLKLTEETFKRLLLPFQPDSTADGVMVTPQLREQLDELLRKRE